MKATSGIVYIARGLSRNDTRGESCEVVHDRTRGREIHGLTCRTWVHGPLKLLSAATWEAAHVSLRTHWRNASRADSRPWGATWSVETGPIPRAKRAPVENTERDIFGWDISGIKIRRWTSWQFNRKATAGSETRDLPMVTKANANVGKLS